MSAIIARWGAAALLVAAAGAHAQTLQFFGTGGSTPAPPLRAISVQNRFPQQLTSATSATSPGMSQRWPFIVGANAKDLVLSFMSFEETTTGEVNFTGSYTISACAIENNGETLTTPVTFSGGRSITITSGQNDIQSDALTPSGLSETNWNSNEQYWLKCSYTYANTNNMGYQTLRVKSQVSTTQTKLYDLAATTPSSVDGLGQFTFTGTAPTDQAQGYGFNPIILGHPLTDGPSWYINGDSIAAGVGDYSGGQPIGTEGAYGTGYIQRSMHTTSFTNPMPSINNGVPGIAYPAIGPLALAYLKYARFAEDEMGTNDVSAGVSLATLETREASFDSTARTAGISCIVRPDLIVVTNSTDNWVTAANQTPKSTGWTAGNVAEQFNTFNASNASVDHTVSMASMKDATTPEVWLTNGTGAPNYLVYTDGTHPSTTGANTAAALNRTVIALCQ